MSNLLRPSIARLSEVVNDEITCAMIGQKLNSIDITDAMARGKVIILNIPQNRPLKIDTMRTLGRTFNNLVIDGMGQLTGSGIHVHYILDEGYFFATEDTARNWDTLLKAGLQTTFAHHYLAQVDQHGGPIVRESLLSNGGGIRVTFRLNNVLDAKFWAEQVFFNQYDPLKKKYSRMDKRFEPVLKERVVKTSTRGGARNWDTTTTIGGGVSKQKSYTDIETDAEGEGEVDNIVSISGAQRAAGKIGMSGSIASTGMSEFNGTESPLVTHHEGETSTGGKTEVGSENDRLAIGNARVRNRIHANGTADTKGTTTSVQTSTAHREGGSDSCSEA